MTMKLNYSTNISFSVYTFLLLLLFGKCVDAMLLLLVIVVVVVVVENFGLTIFFKFYMDGRLRLLLGTILHN